MIKLSELFEIKYGHSLELCNQVQDDNGINFVSRTAKNNGISAKIAYIDGVEPFAPGSLSVALGGSVLETFVQPCHWYAGFHIANVTPRIPMTGQELFFYATCIKSNKYRYNYGRQANKTLKDIMVPSLQEIPAWARNTATPDYSSITEPATPGEVPALDTATWGEFKYPDLFELKRGKSAPAENGTVPLATSSSMNNGISDMTDGEPEYQGGAITVANNGSVGEAFYQPNSFSANSDVTVLVPKFDLSSFIALFLIATIRKEKPRFNYGRKWGLDRMKQSTIKLPITSDGTPDWDFMEGYIKSLKYSKTLG